MFKIVEYSVDKFPFAEIVSDILNVRRLDDLHQLGKMQKFTRETDQKTPFHERYYQNQERLFSYYDKLLQDVFGEHLIGTGNIVCQIAPTFRVHLPENIAVGEFHKDSDYKHQKNEINFWLPFTNAFGTNSIWIESQPDMADYQPAKVDYGQVLIFKGSMLRHGNKMNDTGKTRVSVDFRGMRKSEYDPDCDGASINTKMKFLIGGYYKEISA